MEKRSVCLFCSLGCGLGIEVDGGGALGIEYYPEHPVNNGRLCPRGHYALELLNHPHRLYVPQIRDGEGLRKASWDEALNLLATRIDETRKSYGPQSIGIVLDPNHTNEEVEAGLRLAEAIGTSNFSCSFSPEDYGLLKGLRGLSYSEIKAEELEEFNCILVIGSLFESHPILAKRVIGAKYKKRGNSLIVIDPQRTNTALFANIHLENRPGSEALVLAGILKSLIKGASEEAVGKWGGELKAGLENIPDEAISQASGIRMGQLAEAARVFNDSEKGVVILSPGFGRHRGLPELAQLSILLANLSKGEKGILPLFTFGNALGSYRAAPNPVKTFPQLIEDASGGGIKLLLLFGEDILSAYPSEAVQKAIGQVEFLVSAGLFPSEISKFAHIVLPSASWLEKSGTVSSFKGRDQVLEPVLPPPGIARPDLEIMSQLATRLGFSLEPKAQRKAEKGISIDIQGLIRGVASLPKEMTAEEEGAKEEYPYLLVGEENSIHFADGSITRNFGWAMEVLPSPYIEINTRDAEKLGLDGGGEVLVRSRSGESTLPVQITDRIPQGVLFAPSHFPQVRCLYGWRIDPDLGYLESRPERVSLMVRD